MAMAALVAKMRTGKRCLLSFSWDAFQLCVQRLGLRFAVGLTRHSGQSGAVLAAALTGSSVASLATTNATTLAFLGCNEGFGGVYAGAGHVTHGIFTAPSEGESFTDVSLSVSSAMY